VAEFLHSLPDQHGFSDLARSSQYLQELARLSQAANDFGQNRTLKHFALLVDQFIVVY
jgi:hypothetical protein